MMRILFTVAGLIVLTALMGCTTIRKGLDSVIESRVPAQEDRISVLLTIQPGEYADGRADHIAGIG